MHHLTRENISSINEEVNAIYAQYKYYEPIVNFSLALAADFKERIAVTAENNVVDSFASVDDVKNIIKSRNIKKSAGVHHNCLLDNNYIQSHHKTVNTTLLTGDWHQSHRYPNQAKITNT